MIPGREFSVEYVTGALKRRKLWVIVPVVVLTAVAVVVSLQLKNMYFSQTVILVIPQSVPADYVRPTVTQPIESRLRTISEQIRSRSRLERIITELSLYPEERKTKTMEAVVAGMNASINLQLARGDSFTLGFTYGDAQVAAKVAGRLASMFIDENVHDREQQAEGTSAFLESELEEARRRLIDQEKKLEEYRRKYAGQLPSQVTSNLQVITTTQQQIQTLTDATNRHRDQRNTLLRQIADAEAAPPPPLPVQPPQAASHGTQDPTAAAGGTPAQQLDAAQRELTARLGRLTHDHPDVVRLKRRIAELEPKVKAEAAAAGAAPAQRLTPLTLAEVTAQNRLRDLRSQVTTLERQIASNESEEIRLRRRIADYQTRVDALPARESELAELTRDYGTLQKSYQGLLSKKEDSQLAASLERQKGGEQFRVLDPARVPERAASPNRPLIIAGGTIAGLALGLLLAAGVEIRDSSLRTQKDVVDALQLPVLALIPLMVTRLDTERRRRSRMLAGLAGALVTAGVGVAWWLLRRGGSIG